MFEVEFVGGNLIGLNEYFNATGNTPMQMNLTISYAAIKYRGIVYLQKWQKTDPFLIGATPTVLTVLEPKVARINWQNDQGESIEETAYGKQVMLVAEIDDHEGGSATITIEKEDGSEFENGQKQLTFEEAVDEEGKIELTTLEIKEQWEEFKKADVDKLVATVEHEGTSKKSGALQIAPPTLKKFMIHFRRPTGYQGKYGFDWLRDEYIYPIETVTNDNDGTPIGVPKALCKDVNKLKIEYKDTSLSPYGKDYYPAWLAIFPYTTTKEFKHGSRMHKNGVSLDIEIEELESLTSDATEIIFECTNKNVIITPNKLKLKDLIGSKKTKNLGGTDTRDYYLATKKINIKNTKAPLKNHEEIKVFAKLGSKKEEVGKLILYKNDVIPKAEIVAVNVITGSSSASLRNDYQYLFKKQSFNQALIRAEVKVDTKFDINSLPIADTDVINFKANYINASSNIGTSKSEAFKNDLIALYEKFGKHAPSAGIDTNTNKRTYLFFTSIKAQDNFPGGGWSRVQGECSADENYNSSGVLTGLTWGNAYVIYSTALSSRRTVLHEGAHSFSLTHTFQEGTIVSPHVFYKGFIDNIMDYVNQVGVRTRNPFEVNDKMNCFFKWQWDIMRTDRSLILNY